MTPFSLLLVTLAPLVGAARAATTKSGPSDPADAIAGPSQPDAGPSQPDADPEELEEEEDLEQDEYDFIVDIESIFEHFKQYTFVFLYSVLCKYVKF